MPPPPGPGPVAVVHRITIVTALLGALAFTAWGVSQANVLAGSGGLAATTAAALYLRNLRGRLERKLTPGRTDPS